MQTCRTGELIGPAIRPQISPSGQPGAAGYLRRPGETAFSPFVLTVLHLGPGHVIDIAAFEQPSMFTAFGLPASL